MCGRDLYEFRTRHSLVIVSWVLSWGTVVLRSAPQARLPKVVEHLRFNLHNILAPWWTDRRLNRLLRMNLRDKPRQVHTCLSVYPDASAAFVGGSLFPQASLAEADHNLYNPRALLGLFFNAGGFSSHLLPKTRLTASSPLSGHTWRTHNASSSSHFKPYGKRESETKIRALCGFTGLVWWETNYSVLCLLTSRCYRLILSRPICPQVLVNYKA